MDLNSTIVSYDHFESMNSKNIKLFLYNNE